MCCNVGEGILEGVREDRMTRGTEWDSQLI